MAVDERNFRSAYYEKVGFKSVEEKRSLEILLKEKHLDISKLRQFCLRFGVPAALKNLVWKLLLGVLPAQESCHTFVYEQRKEVYSNLLRALSVMKYNNADVPKPQVFILMYFLQAGKLVYGKHQDEEKYMYPIVNTVMFFFDSDPDVYWIGKGFYDIVQKFQCEVPKLTEASQNLLYSEDHQLYKHLLRISALDSLPWDIWLKSCFAGVIDNVALGKIWDKICAGSYKILVYTAVMVLITMKLKLLKCQTAEDVLNQVNNISEDIAEVIVTKSIELWQQQGSPSTVNDKPKPSQV